MKLTALHRHLLTGVCLVAFITNAGANPGSITARLQPQSVAVGESAQLTVTLKDSPDAAIQMPAVDGLDIVSVGEQSSMQMINGTVTADVSHIYQVTPNRAGSFTIPALAVAGAGHTQPIAFRAENGAGRPAQTPGAQQSGFRLGGHHSSGGASVDAKGEPAFLRVVLPKQELTVGELVPVEVKAYFRAGVSASLNGLPMLGSDAFALNKLGDQPEQTHESVGGVPYTVVTWNTALSAVKAGEYPLNLDLPVMVRMKARGQRGTGGRNPFKDLFGDDSPFGGSILDDSVFDDFFGQATEKPLTLHTDGAVVKIKALPTQGRPANFSGAVGKFDITSEASAASATAGDPLTLKIKISGQGNFDRVSTPGLAPGSAWKSYKPSVHLDSTDPSNTSGTKTFEQSIVPIKAGEQEIPAVSFSYFDPDTQGYVTKATSLIRLSVAQGAAPATAVSSTAPVPADPAPKINPDGLAADEVVPARGASSLRPLVLTPWFVVVNSALLLALACGAIFRGLSARRVRDPRRQEQAITEQAVSESVAAMDAALQAKDAPRFFAAARRSLQELLASRWHVPANRVTIPEIRHRLPDHGDKVQAVFQTADEIAYSGRRFTALDLQQWRDLVLNQLHALAR